MSRAAIVRVALAVGLLSAAVGAASSDARACVPFREFARPQVKAPKNAPAPRLEPSALVASAERALDEGKLQEVATSLVTAFPKLRDLAPGASALTTRALRLMALATVRSDGRLVWRGRGAATTEKEQTANLQWAVASLRNLDAIRPNDPVVQADLGEALSKVAKHHDEARALLEGLAARDLMGSPTAYAALAKLRLAAGDRAASDAAVKRCEAMSTQPAAACRVTPAPAVLASRS